MGIRLIRCRERKRCIMPVIKIEWAAGRNDEAKKKIDESITDIITENTGVNSESVIVIFEDIPQNSLYIGRKSLG